MAESSTTDSPAQVPVAPVYAASLALCAAVSLAGGGGWSAAPPPWAWWDVAVVGFVCALPPAAWVASLCAAWLNRRAAAIGGVLLLGLAAASLSAAGELAAPSLTNALWLGLLRGGPMFLLAAALALLVSALIPRTAGRTGAGKPRLAPFAGVLGALILAALPSLYVEARCRSDAGRLSALIEQSRFGDAASLARGMLVLDPDQEFDGRPLRRAAAALERRVRELEAKVAEPLEPNAADARRVERARDLAMLGREREALAALDGLARPDDSVEALNLRGTIHETLEEWEPAGAWYARARRAATIQPPSPDQQAALADALRGAAYANRKLGRYHEAEAAYLDLLDLAPTAQTHFLLAKFYEDTQQSAAARRHARAAVTLEPGRYDEAAEKLIDRLQTLHFGCAGVFLAERGFSEPPTAELDAPAAAGEH